MADKPILFSGAMVRDVIKGSKTQTRRVMKPQPFLERSEKGSWWMLDRSEDGYGRTNSAWPEGKEPFWTYCPYGKPGDRLWVRETFSIGWLDGGKVLYRADGGSAKEAGYPSEPVYKPSIHMPRWASRLTLEITQVRVERVQDISLIDCQAEGITLEGDAQHDGAAMREAFRKLWDSINSNRGFGWDKNPWVWAISFRKVEAHAH